jgi:hypothetical protein
MKCHMAKKKGRDVKLEQGLHVFTSIHAQEVGSGVLDGDDNDNSNSKLTPFFFLGTLFPFTKKTILINNLKSFKTLIPKPSSP